MRALFLANLAVVVVLLGLLIRAQWQRQELEQQRGNLAAGIADVARVNAQADLLAMTGLYYIVGKVHTHLQEEFDARFASLGVTARCTGCLITPAQQLYVNHYNAVIQSSLEKQHGRDLIAEFRKHYLSIHQ